MTLTIFLGITVVLVGWLAIREIILFQQASDGNRLRRLTLRLTTALMLLFLLMSIYLGIEVFHLGTPEGLPRHWLAYWGSVLLLAGGILCMVMADLRMLQADTQDDTRVLWQDIAETIARHRTGQQHDDTHHTTHQS